LEKPYDVADLVQPDLFLPSQFVDRHRPGPSYIQKLAYAIIDISLNDLKLLKLRSRNPGRPPTLNGGLGNPGLIARKSKNYTSASAWLKDTKDDSLFSFDSCCELLSIDAGLLRSKLLQLIDAREGVSQ